MREWRGLAAALAAGAVLLVLARSGVALPAHAIELSAFHTGERLTLIPDADGRFSAERLAALRHLLRDHRNGEEHEMDPALLDLLGAVAERCQRPPRFEVISGYRSPASNAQLRAAGHAVAEHSQHLQGKAIDVRLEGCALVRLRDAALALARGGVGYYPGEDFVHLDTGRVRSWSG